MKKETKTFIRKINDNNNVTIPKELVEEWELKVGDYVKFTKDGSRVVLEKAVIE